MTFEDIETEYTALWQKAEIKKESINRVIKVCQKIVANEAIYREIEFATATPWFMIAAIHNMESSLDFTRCLHNGDPWNKPTVHVPKGLGPWKSFTESAIDAIKFDGLQGPRDWTIERILYLCEAYNGTGYRQYHPSVPSPYLWANTTISSGKGKYVADGKFDANAPNDDQIGVAAILKWLQNYGYISLKSSHAAQPAPVIPKPMPIDEKPVLPMPAPQKRSFWTWLKSFFRRK